MYFYLCVCVCVNNFHICGRYLWSPEAGIGSLGLELHVVVSYLKWVLGMEPGVLWKISK